MITLEIAICDQRRSYMATFANGFQAVAKLKALTARDKAQGYEFGNHAWYELEDDPITPQVGPISEDALFLHEFLYPSCEHGLSLAMCAGPGHYPPDM